MQCVRKNPYNFTANFIMSRTEDEVRDSAKVILGLNDNEPNVKQGTGQITTFNQLDLRAS